MEEAEKVRKKSKMSERCGQLHVALAAEANGVFFSRPSMQLAVQRVADGWIQRTSAKPAFWTQPTQCSFRPPQIRSDQKWKLELSHALSAACFAAQIRYSQLDIKTLCSPPAAAHSAN